MCPGREVGGRRVLIYRRDVIVHWCEEGVTGLKQQDPGTVARPCLAGHRIPPLLHLRRVISTELLVAFQAIDFTFFDTFGGCL